jgi:oxygen-independent coproporphyrinogen-3 oxidase
LAEGFSLAWFAERTGLPASALEPGLSQAIEADWLTLEEGWLRPTPKGLDFLSNVQQLFL